MEVQALCFLHTCMWLILRLTSWKYPNWYPTQTDFQSHKKSQAGIYPPQTNFRHTENPNLVPLTQTRSPAMLLTASNFLIKHKLHCVVCRSRLLVGHSSKLSPLWWFYLLKSFHLLGDPTTLFRRHAWMPECHTKPPPSCHRWASRYCCTWPPSNIHMFRRTVACSGWVLPRSWSHVPCRTGEIPWECSGCTACARGPDGLGMLSENRNLSISLLRVLECILQGLIRIFGMKFNCVGVSHPLF